MVVVFLRVCLRLFYGVVLVSFCDGTVGGFLSFVGLNSDLERANVVHSHLCCGEKTVL